MRELNVLARYLQFKSQYRHSSIYAVNVGTQKKTAEAIPCKLRLPSSTKGEGNRIEL